ncbi:MAG TPA: hypothetical protein VF637_18990 [Sphingomicrobium sp.]|jgi:hypothetical protein
MTGLNQISSAQPHALKASRARQLTHHSSMRENVFEHLLLGQLGAELLARGVEYDELYSSVDKEGFDVVLEAGNIVRHIQFKVMISGGSRSRVTVSTRLASRPSGCVVWLTYSPEERSFCNIRWFGAAPGQPLPDLGDKVARHTRSNSSGVKADRPDHRTLPASRFDQLDSIGHLADRLFGRLPVDLLAFLRSRLRPDWTAGHSQPWLHDVADGRFAAIPTDICWKEAIGLRISSTAITRLSCSAAAIFRLTSNASGMSSGPRADGRVTP